MLGGGAVSAKFMHIQGLRNRFGDLGSHRGQLLRLIAVRKEPIDDHQMSTLWRWKKLGVPQYRRALRASARLYMAGPLIFAVLR